MDKKRDVIKPPYSSIKAKARGERARKLERREDSLTAPDKSILILYARGIMFEKRRASSRYRASEREIIDELL